jgi:hypothetical protein
VALEADARPGEPLQVHIAAPHGIGVHAVELCA